nr:hypothetical protein [Tanacetum cinerariifolium]
MVVSLAGKTIQDAD